MAWGLAQRAAKFLFKPHFTRNRRSGWQSNNIFPRLAGSSKAAGAYAKLNFHPKKAQSG